MKVLHSPGRTSQSGVALLVALMILVIVSLLGVTAMKTSMFSAKIATGSQVDAMAFEGAESAVNASFGQLAAAGSSGLQPLLNGATLNRCLTAAQGLLDRGCAGSDRSDSRGLVRAGSRLRLNGMEPISGEAVGFTGNSSVKVDFRIEILGQSEIDDFHVDNNHLQEALKRGPVASSDLQNLVNSGQTNPGETP
ncbi:pilus assembly PilX family protein [Alloalcanivorax mobilis]|uniref:pilus assembly PilX family protein n=1 Tax=Alloalcanivorax mobilis TaxID=2019569 RepID=UPI00130008ED|nr:PilX N-terminal domain-containing pilus assembly protein [Alloalcanivorax mobilis]